LFHLVSPRFVLSRLALFCLSLSLSFDLAGCLGRGRGLGLGFGLELCPGPGTGPTLGLGLGLGLEICPGPGLGLVDLGLGLVGSLSLNPQEFICCSVALFFFWPCVGLAIYFARQIQMPIQIRGANTYTS
jgi:hypothetical protein